MFQIQIRCWDRVLSLNVRKEDTVEELKERIEKEENKSVDEQHLFLSSQELENSFTLEEYNIQEGTQLHLTSSQVFVMTLTGKTITINDALLSDSVYSVLLRIEEKEGIPPDRQRHIYAGKQIYVLDTLRDYGVSFNSTLYLVLRLGGTVAERYIAVELPIPPPPPTIFTPAPTRFLPPPADASSETTTGAKTGAKAEARPAVRGRLVRCEMRAVDTLADLKARVRSDPRVPRGSFRLLYYHAPAMEDIFADSSLGGGGSSSRGRRSAQAVKQAPAVVVVGDVDVDVNMDAAYQVRNGMQGLGRNVVMRLLMAVADGSTAHARIRTILGTCEEFFMWRKHSAFAAGRRLDKTVQMLREFGEDVSLKDCGINFAGKFYLIRL